MSHKKGDRVGAIICAKDGVVKFLGFGVYMGDEIPPPEAGGFNYGIPNPKIQLDNGETVYGCECWWGGEAKIQSMIEEYEKIERVSINDIRKQGRRDADTEARA